jgi:organic hydroperoxide reductase OsmC/OhrA
MSKHHFYTLKIQWTGNRGEGTAAYDAYERSHTISIEHKLEIFASADTPFRGDQNKPNPEDFFLASLSSCHMLWFLHLCADAGIVVVDYVDHPTATLLQQNDGSGYFTEVVLHPTVAVSEEAMIEKADALHTKANEKCFIANSVNFKVKHEAVCVLALSNKTSE